MTLCSLCSWCIKLCPSPHCFCCLCSSFLSSLVLSKCTIWLSRARQALDHPPCVCVDVGMLECGGCGCCSCHCDCLLLTWAGCSCRSLYLLLTLPLLGQERRRANKKTERGEDTQFRPWFGRREGSQDRQNLQSHFAAGTWRRETSTGTTTEQRQQLLQVKVNKSSRADVLFSASVTLLLLLSLKHLHSTFLLLFSFSFFLSSSFLLLCLFRC